MVLYYTYFDNAVEDIECKPSHSQVGMILPLMPSFQAEIKDHMPPGEWIKLYEKIKPPPALQALLKIVLPVDKQWRPYVPDKDEALGAHILAKKLGASPKAEDFSKWFEEIPEMLKARYNEFETSVDPLNKGGVAQGVPVPPRRVFLKKQCFPL